MITRTTNFLFYAIILLIGTNVYAQNRPNLTINKEPKLFDIKSHQNESARLSPLTNSFLVELNSKSNKKSSSNTFLEEFRQKYLIRTTSEGNFVGGLIKVNDKLNESALPDIGLAIGTKAGNIWTVRIPILKIEELKSISGIDYIQIDEPITNKLDNARSSTFVKWVQDGYLLPQSYYGNNVVIGIIDCGFDYTHPVFYDSTYTNYRVKRVWEQISTNGTPPSGFDYGSELRTENEILNTQTDYPNGTHGTHVAGIAAGSGGGTNGKYRGVAPASDIILVSYKGPLATGQSVVIDAIKYIFSYAESVDMPAVINMSLGIHIGPHNGTSLFDQACDNLTGQGKIVVGAAGNEGDKPLHLEYNFTSTDTSFITFVEFEDPDSKNGMIDIWGQEGKDFGINIALYDPNNQSISDETLFWFPSEEAVETIYLIGSDYDTCTVGLSTNPSEFNNQSRVFVGISNESTNKVLLAGYGKDEISGTIHIWNHGLSNGAAFTNGGESWAIEGNTNITVGEIGGTGKNIISVGAFNTTVTTIGGIASFSSKGSTVDGRTKPDISAPGNRISSSVSSFDTRYLDGGANWPDVVSSITDGTNYWHFAKIQGTSMSSPMVTGIIALWLEANPNLTPSQIKQLMQNYSWVDDYTGTVPNNTWGWGKIDAHEGIRQILANLPPKPEITIIGNTIFCEGESVILSAPLSYSYLWSNGEDSQSIIVTQSGKYIVNVVDSNGWISASSDTIQIVVNLLPNKPTIEVSGETTFCYGNSVTLSAPSGYTYSWSNGDSEQNIEVDSTGSYTLTLTDGNNCTSPPSEASNIIVNDLPAVDLGDDATITTNDIIILDAGIGFASYLWNNDSITQTLEIDALEIGTGIYNYFVTVTDDNTCSNSDTIKITIETGTGVNNLIPEPLIKLYPNPTTGIVNMVIDDLRTQELIIEVLNVTGKLVYLNNIVNMRVNTIIEIDLSDQPKGMYFIKLCSDRMTNVEKVLIQ